METDPKAADTIANLIVLNTLMGKKDETVQLKETLKSVDKGHRALADWEEKRSEFEKAKSRYTPVFEV